MSPSVAQMSERVDATRAATAALNLHVPPSYFASRTGRELYEVALVPFLNSEDQGPLSLYIGIPLCAEHCRFCMYFAGLIDDQGMRTEACLAGLEAMLAAVAPVGDRPIASIYTGGGTPSVLEPSQIVRLCNGINAAFDFESGAQRTFEMSPGTATVEKIQAIVAGGYNRVSFGVQTFDAAAIAASGRSYFSPDAVARLLVELGASGVTEVNVDLLVGMEGIGPGTLATDVRALLGAGCDTISLYRYRPARADEIVRRGGMDRYVSSCIEQIEVATAVAVEYGYVRLGPVHGEHVRFARSTVSPFPDRNHYETRHRPEISNSLLGIGASARSTLRDRRYLSCKHRSTDGYELIGRLVDVEDCDPPERLAAGLVNAFYRSGEADFALHQQATGLDPADVYADELGYLERIGALEIDGTIVRVSPLARDEWVYLDKLLYPPIWLAERLRSERLRVR